MLSEGTAVLSIGCARVQQLGSQLIPVLNEGASWVFRPEAQERSSSVSGASPSYMESQTPSACPPTPCAAVRRAGLGLPDLALSTC